MEAVTLDSVAKAFQQWREGRINRSEPIPDALWKQAVALYPEYKRSIICRRLRLSASQFNEHLGNKDSLPSASGFVQASHQTPEKVSGSKQTIELCIQGEARNLKISVGMDLLSAVLVQVGALL